LRNKPFDNKLFFEKKGEKRSKPQLFFYLFVYLLLLVFLFCFLACLFVVVVFIFNILTHTGSVCTRIVVEENSNHEKKKRKEKKSIHICMRLSDHIII